MRRFLTIGLCSLAVAACVDEQPSTPLSPGTPIRRQELPTGEVGRFWRTPDTLQVYDRRPELAMNIAHTESRHMTRMNDLGLRLLRATAYWRDIEPAEGVFDNSKDPVFAWDAVMAQNPFEVVVVLNDHPEWANEGNATCTNPALFIGRFSTYVKHMVATHPRVRFWQIGNEPDAGMWPGFIHCGWTRQWAGQHYAWLLTTAYESVKSVNPNAYVVTAAFTGTEHWDGQENLGLTDNGSWEFLDGFLAWNGGLARRRFDVFAFHSYGITAHGALDADADAVRSRIGDRMIWATEVGTGAANTLFDGQRHIYTHWPHNRGLDDAATFDSAQANWTKDALQILAPGSRFSKMFPYAYSGDGQDNVPPTAYSPDPAVYPREGPTGLAAAARGDYGLGLIRMDETPRPAYYELHQKNGTILGNPSQTGDITVYAPNFHDPVWPSWTRSGDYVTLHNVTVGNLLPLQIPFVRTVYRLHRVDISGSLYSNQSDEGVAQGWTLTTTRWQVANGTAPGLSPLKRCYNGTNHWVAVNGCGGATDEGTLGYVATAATDGTVPLYSARRDSNGDYVQTTDVNEYNGLAAQGFTLHGVIAYVWPRP